MVIFQHLLRSEHIFAHAETSSEALEKMLKDNIFLSFPLPWKLHFITRPESASKHFAFLSNCMQYMCCLQIIIAFIRGKWIAVFCFFGQTIWLHFDSIFGETFFCCSGLLKLHEILKRFFFRGDKEEQI